MSRTTVREALAVIGAFGAVAIVATRPLILGLGDSLPVSLGGGPLLNTLLLAWDADRLLHGLQGWWDLPIFYPYTNALGFSENLLGIAVFTAPLQWLTGDPVVVYNLAYIASYVLAGGGMYLLARSLTGDRLAAGVAGLLFVFVPFRGQEAGHLQSLVYGWMPIGLWALHRYFATGRRTALAGFAAAFVLAGLSNGHFFFFFAPVVVIVAGLEVIFRVRSRPRMLIDLPVAAALMLAAVLPVMSGYLATRDLYGTQRSRQEVISYAANTVAWLDPGTCLAMLAVCGLLAATLRRGPDRDATRSDRRIAFMYALVAVAGVALALGPEPTVNGVRLMASGPYDWLRGVVPGLEGLRVPRRAIIITLLALTVLAAFGVRYLTERLPRRPARVFALFLCVVAVVEDENYRRGPLVAFETPPSLHAAQQWLRTRPPGAVLSLPAIGLRQGDYEGDLRAMYGTLTHGHPVMNGASGFFPPLYWFFYSSGALESFEDYDYADVLRGLRALGVRYVLVYTDADLADVEKSRATLGAVRNQPEQIVTHRDFGGVTVFELTPWDDRPPAPAPERPPISRGGVSATTSHNPGELVYAFDGDLGTRWLSGQRQTGNEEIIIYLDQPTDVSHLRVTAGRSSHGDYPRHLVIDSTADGRTWKTLHSGRSFERLLHGAVAVDGISFMDFPLPPNTSRLIRLRQTGSTPRFYWSFHELELWARD
ncbi:MAG: hypothetical protein F4Y45_04535 [Acidobacteria bacterium]|nr:hypothetical protein [Acidobacteriota bacterium]MYJ06035.1 hypothetical protein [Acidobacteriota bacterium]